MTARETRYAVALRQFFLRRIAVPRPQRQLIHDRTPLGMRITRPIRDLIERAIATDAHTGLWIDHTDFFAGRFDGLKRRYHEVIIAGACSKPVFEATSMSDVHIEYALVSLSGKLPTSAGEHSQLRDASRFLLDVLSLEEKLDLILSNNLELEIDLLAISARDAVLHEMLDEKFHSNRVLLNRRLVNLLGSCRAYLDCAAMTVISVFGRESQQEAWFKGVLSNSYDNTLGYRVMEAMRNYALHREFPVHRVTYSSSLHEEESRNRFSFNVSPFVSVQRLKEVGGFKSSVLKEIEAIGENLDLKPLIRDYVGCIATAQSQLRDVFQPRVDVSKKIILDARAKYARHFAFDHKMELLFSLRFLGENVAEEIVVNTTTVERIEVLVSRNAGFANYGARYVTNAIDK